MASLNVDKFLKNLGQSKPSINSSKSFAGQPSNKLVLFAMVLIGIAIILVLIHFLVYPIFKTKMGSKGFIPLPTTPEGYLLWDDKVPDSLPITGTPIENKSADYTISLDAYIEIPNDITNKYRTLFTRQQSSSPNTTIDNPTTIKDQIGNYNLAVYLEKGTNDLYVSVMDTNLSVKTIKIKNTPVREPFRLVVVLSDMYMDTYINGALSGSVTFSTPPYAGANILLGPSVSSIKVKRVKIFDKALQPAEAKDIRPGLSEFTPTGDIPNSSSCPTLSTYMNSIVQ
jgi:hypothetical protein